MSIPRATDVPPGMRKLVDYIAKQDDRIAQLEAALSRVCNDLRIDPADPAKGINGQQDAPAATSPIQQKLSGLDDTDTFNVLDKQVLTWDQQKQAWTPQGTQGVQTFTPDSSITFDPNGPVSALGVGETATSANGEDFGYLGWHATDPRKGEIEGRVSIGGYVSTIALTGPTAYFNQQNTASQSLSEIALQQDGSVTIQSNSSQTSSDYDMYTQIVAAHEEIILLAAQGSGTGAGGTVKVQCKWFVIPVAGNGTVPATGKQGAMILDPSLNKPLWSDGTNWRDATGTIV